MDEDQLKRYRLEMSRRAAIGLPLTPQAEKEQDERSLPFLTEPELHMPAINPLVADEVEKRLNELTRNFNDGRLTWRQRIWRWIVSKFRWLNPSKP